MRIILVLIFSLVSTFCFGKEIKVLGSDELIDATNFAECVLTNYDTDKNEYNTSLIYINLMKPTVFVGGRGKLDGIFIRYDCIVDAPAMCFMDVPKFQDSGAVAARGSISVEKDKTISENHYSYQISSSTATIAYDTARKQFEIDKNDSKSILMCDTKLRHIR